MTWTRTYKPVVLAGCTAGIRGLVGVMRPVAIITINRPEVRNACDGPTGGLLFEAVQQAESDDTIVATVLTGAEGTFCAAVTSRLSRSVEGIR